MGTEFFEFLGPIIALFLIGTCVLLFPVSRRLGRVMEEWIRLRHEASPDRAKLGSLEEEMRETRRLLETVDQRLELLAERQAFTESLLESRGAARLPGNTEPTPDH